jgi:hypothetical protein
MAKHPSKELAKAGDPLVTPNGEVLEPEGEEDWGADGLDLPAPMTPIAFKHYRPITRKVISDLRAPAQAINVSLVVLGYTLLGISDSEICEATGLDAQSVMRVREARTYSDAFELIMQELINANSEYIECRLAAYSGLALNNIAHIARKTKNTGYRLAASKDLLDRAGHRPQDQASRQNSGMNELHIVITTPKDNVDTKLDFHIEGKGNGHGNE